MPLPRANYHDIPIGERAPDEVNVIVEIPAGSSNKYEYDEKLGVFRLDRALHSSTYYPGDYGFVPQTLALDGDPLDALILVVEPTFVGCLVAARPIGVLYLTDEGTPDEKLLAVPLGEPAYAEIRDYTQILAHQVRVVEHFFQTYKLLEEKHVRVGGWGDAAAARRKVIEAANRFRGKHMPTDRPEFPRDKLRAAVPDDARAQAEIDALHDELSADRPEAGTIKAHVERLRARAPLSALIASWFEDPRTQAFIEELTAAGL